MMSNDLTCQELVELVTDHVEGVLSPADRQRFDDHLAGCVGCRRYLDQMRQTILTVGRLRESDLTTEAREELLSLFRTWKRPSGDVGQH